MNKGLQRVSLTGADDRTTRTCLAALGLAYPFVEWALLYVPHNEGAPRNPTQAWREAFFDAKVPGYSAVHLCGSLAFEQLRTRTLPGDIRHADRIQLNVNARKPELSDSQCLALFEEALALGPDVILQWHEFSTSAIVEFLAKLPREMHARVQVLMDSSRGTGTAPASWKFAALPSEAPDVLCGFAGGLGPDNIEGVLTELTSLASTHAKKFWVDMESGIRTNNQFDPEKAKAVLCASAPFASSHAKTFAKTGIAL